MLRTRLTAAVATGAVLVALCACGNAPAGSQGKATASAPAQQTKTVQIKKSPDKYTHYVKNRRKKRGHRQRRLQCGGRQKAR